VMGAIAEMFNNALQDPQVFDDRQNIVELMVNSFHKNQEIIENDLDKARDVKRKMKALGERIKCDQGNMNIFVMVLNDRIKSLNEKEVEMLGKKKLVKDVLSELAHYRSVTRLAATMQMYGSQATANTAWR